MPSTSDSATIFSRHGPSSIDNTYAPDTSGTVLLAAAAPADGRPANSKAYSDRRFSVLLTKVATMLVASHPIHDRVFYGDLSDTTRNQRYGAVALQPAAEADRSEADR